MTPSGCQRLRKVTAKGKMINSKRKLALLPSTSLKDRRLCTVMTIHTRPRARNMTTDVVRLIIAKGERGAVQNKVCSSLKFSLNPK